MSLYATEIYDILKADEFSKTIFKAVLTRNELSSKVTFPSAYILNNKSSYHLESIGLHFSMMKSEMLIFSALLAGHQHMDLQNIFLKH
jgi:hypothetical protein